MSLWSTLPRAAVAALCLAALHAGAATITFTSSADSIAVNSQCTLREAIVAINGGVASADCPATGGAWGSNDTIAFNIPGGGVKVIQPAAILPALVRRVTVDGYTQPGAMPNTVAAGSHPNATGMGAQIMIELDGSLIAGGFNNGLHFNTAAAGNSLVRGLAIVRFDTGIRINGAPATTVAGNHIGWHADGTTRGANTTGVEVVNADNVRIGQGSAANRNLIAGGSLAGVSVIGTTSLWIDGNLIGVDRNGAQGGMLTQGVGIALQNVTGANITNNVVSNHQFDGIYLYGVQNSTITGNTLGEGVGGVALLNGQRGIAIGNSGTTVSSGNSVRGNGIAHSGIGIEITGSALSGDPLGNRLDNNSIYANGLGIDLRPVAETGAVVTVNDAGDADTGPNGLQNFPVVTSAQANANGSITVAFTLDSTPGSAFDISAYANPACHAKGHGEGRYGTGQANTPVTTNAAGQAAGTITVSAPLPPGWGAGAFVALLAHGTEGTSEFSACAQVAAAAGAATPPVMGDVPDQNGAVGTAFNLPLLPYVTTTDGDAVMDWIYTGMLPPGLQLAGGAITGTPTQAGSFTVQVRAGDKDGWSGYDAIVFTIVGAGNPGMPGGPGGAAAIPMLSEWGRLLAALLIGTAGLRVLRRKPQC